MNSSQNSRVVETRRAESSALAARDAQVDSGLVAVIQAWPKLPEALRRAVLPIVEAMSGSRRTI